MQRFNYPLDVSKILRKKKSIKKEFSTRVNHLIEIKLAILGGSTTSEIKNILELIFFKQ